jgi:chromosome segregation ATPase
MQQTTPPSQPDQVNSNNYMKPTSPSQRQTPPSSALLPAMTASDGFDFEAQYEDAKHSLKFFDEAIPKKKDLERAVDALESAKSEKAKLQEHKQQAKAVLEEKRQNWRELRAAHDKNQQEWRRRSIKVDDVLFKVDNHFVLRYRRGIESQIEFAKENLRLLEERRQVDQAHAAVNKVRQTHKDLQARSYHQDEKIKGCEDEVLKVKKALDDALERLKTNNRGLEPVERLRTPPAQVYTQGAR